jgi:mono/diheme cytochrome c family protein
MYRAQRVNCATESESSFGYDSAVLRQISRLLLYLLALVVVAVAGGFSYLFLALPRVAPPAALEVPRTPERIARGQYLSRHVAGCSDCHGERDSTKYSAPQMPEREGHGGMAFSIGVGTLYAPNITPARLSTWSDGEVLRAMTSGVSKDGSPLFPLMPYDAYRQMSREDAESIIAFIRTLPPAARDVPPSKLDFPMNLIVRTMPSPAPPLPEKAPNPSDRLAYGEYLTTMASCVTCHTKMESGQPVPGMAFAGGLEFLVKSGGVQYSANITSDAETGIGRWTVEQFVDRFKSIANADEASLALNGRRNTEMPWRDFGGMTTEDLRAIFAYLQTVPAVRHAVPR